MANYLDKTGLTTLWIKVKALVEQTISSSEFGNFTINGKKISSNPFINKEDVGLGNVDNESKATMFTSPEFTGTPTAPTPSVETESTQIATTEYVANKINSLLSANDSMIFKGTIGTEGTVLSLPDTHYAGWTYKVVTAGSYAGQKCEVGDMIICVEDGTSANNDDWAVVQTNIDGAVTGPTSSTTGHVATFDGATGKVIKDSGFTIGISVPDDAKFTDTDTKVTSVENHYEPEANSGSALNANGGAESDATTGTVQVVVGLTRDAKGHVVGVVSKGIKATNTTYNPASGSANGLMSSSDFTKLTGIADNATADGAITTSEINEICV